MWLDIGKDRGLYKKAVGVSSTVISFTSEYECCFGFADFYVREHLVELTLIDNWSNMRIASCTVAQNQLFCLITQHFNKLVMDVLVEY